MSRSGQIRSQGPLDASRPLRASSFGRLAPGPEERPRGWERTIVIAASSEEETHNSNWSATASLVLRAQQGDRVAFGQLVEQFQRTVYSVALARLGNASEAMELTQEVFLHVMGRLDQLREPERFAGWLRQVTVRMAINRATRRVPPSSIDDEVLDGVAVHRDEPLDELIARERARRLWEGLNQLKVLDRDVLIAFYIRSLSLIEIAEELDVPIGTIKRRLHTARKRLKVQLHNDSVDPDEWTDEHDSLRPEEEAEELLLAAS